MSKTITLDLEKILISPDTYTIQAQASDSTGTYSDSDLSAPLVVIIENPED
jgi:hypothetical protein